MPSAIVFLIASGFNNRGSEGDEKKASRAALVVHSLSRGGPVLDQLAGADGQGDLVLGDQAVENQLRQRTGRTGVDQTEIDRLKCVVLAQSLDILVGPPDHFLEFSSGFLGVDFELPSLRFVESLGPSRVALMSS